MRILVVSNFYPPFFIGGYELACRDTVEGLRQRGHTVQVLTSRFGLRGSEAGVWRWLVSDYGQRPRGLLADFGRLFLKELANRRSTRRAVHLFRPDVVYVWNLWGLSASMLFLFETERLPVAYYVFDGWLAEWENDSWVWLWRNRPRRGWVRVPQAILRRVLAPLVPPARDPDFCCAQFASAYLRNHAAALGRAVGEAEVIHHGIEPQVFPFRNEPRQARRLLYVGQLVPHKGVHTAIEGFARLARDVPDVTFTIVGGTVQPAYREQLHEQVRKLGLTPRVHFTGAVSRERLPEMYRSHDILVFPSLWEEPFGIVLLEAMASGLAVVATGTGGSREILEDGENALLFSPKDPKGLAAALRRLTSDAQLYERLRRNARATVEARFTFARFLDRVEASLARMVAAKPS